MENASIKLVLLSDEQKILFSALDPFEMLVRKSNPLEFALGAVYTDEAAGCDMPAGLMICELLSQALLVRWLFVSPKERGKGFGDKLLNAAVTSAKAEGKDYVFYHIPNEYGRGMVCPNEEEYLEYHGFEQDRSGLFNSEKLYALPLTDDEKEYQEEPVDIFKELMEQGERLDHMSDAFGYGKGFQDNEELLPEMETWEFTAREVSQSSLTGDGKSFGDAAALSEISLPALGECLRHGLKQYSYSGLSGDLYKLPVDWFDMDLSSCVLSDGKVTGVFLVHKVSDDEYLAEYLYAMQSGSSKQLMQLLRRSATVFAKDYAPDTKLKIVSRRVAVKKLLERLFTSGK